MHEHAAGFLFPEGTKANFPDRTGILILLQEQWQISLFRKLRSWHFKTSPLHATAGWTSSYLSTCCHVHPLPSQAILDSLNTLGWMGSAGILYHQWLPDDANPAAQAGILSGKRKGAMASHKKILYQTVAAPGPGFLSGAIIHVYLQCAQHQGNILGACVLSVKYSFCNHK